MGPIPKVHVGAFSMALAGIVSTGELVFSKAMKAIGMPYFRLMAAAALLASLVFGVVAVLSGSHLPKPAQLKWMLLRSSFGTLTVVASVLAVQVGASPGDVAALTSINIVGAALLGHVFLGERVRRLHIGAVCCSVCGAALIAQPAFLFGVSIGEETSPLGNLLALLGGAFISCVFVCARKTAEIPVPVLSMCTTLLAVPLFLLSPHTPLASEASPAALAASPWRSFAFLLIGLLFMVAHIVLSMAGSVLCPAAVSATVYTAAGMVSGYAAEALLFSSTPKPLSIVGAALMLFAVVAMATARRPQQEEAQGESTPACVVPHAETSEPSHVGTESLASFAATEFAEREPHKAVRLRQPRGGGAPATSAQRFGAATAVATSIAI